MLADVNKAHGRSGVRKGALPLTEHRDRSLPLSSHRGRNPSPAESHCSSPLHPGLRENVDMSGSEHLALRGLMSKHPSSNLDTSVVEMSSASACGGPLGASFTSKAYRRVPDITPARAAKSETHRNEAMPNNQKQPAFVQPGAGMAESAFFRQSVHTRRPGEPGMIPGENGWYGRDCEQRCYISEGRNAADGTLKLEQYDLLWLEEGAQCQPGPRSAARTVEGNQGRNWQSACEPLLPCRHM
ncbi:hypothetical protein DENSPDRAFT_501460 [Dentipellis sp. KUC8613]|nr:hypothetical protein DENSPDRAFT_501460 [Dentipellis sp. KUC8613]